jgi:hypothetical protein
LAKSSSTRSFPSASGALFRQDDTSILTLFLPVSSFSALEIFAGLADFSDDEDDFDIDDDEDDEEVDLDPRPSKRSKA